MKRSAAFVAAAAAVLLASPAVAAPPVLISANHIDRHPEATWTLPPGVTSKVAEVATSPATSTDGYFFSENVKAFDILEPAQTHWVYNFQLDPGTYRVCYTQSRRLVCRNRTILGRSWDAWRLRITPLLAGYRAGRVRRYLEFTWRVDRRIVARKPIRIFYDA